MRRILLLSLLMTAAVLPAPARAAGFVVNVTPGANDVPLAMPLPVGEEATAKALWDVVQRDLEMTGYFSLIDPAGYIDTTTGVEPGSFKFSDWSILAAAGLVKTRLTSLPDGGLQADVYIYDVAGQQKILGKRFEDPGASPRALGHRVADAVVQALTGQPSFFSHRLLAVGTPHGNKEIYVLGMDGTTQVPVSRNGSINLSPALSPDGTQVAWTAYLRDNADIWVKDLNTGRRRVLSSNEGVDTGAAWSPDGTKVAVAISKTGEDSDIFVLDSRTGRVLQQVTKGGGIDVSPSWSPDGKKLAFASERSGGLQIYVATLDGGEIKRVTFQGSHNSDPVFSPDGERIAFVGRDRNFDVFTVHVDGKHMSRVTQDQGDNEDPCWSPDGRYLVFSSTRNGSSQLFLSSSDGRHQVPITKGRGGWSQPVWVKR